MSRKGKRKFFFEKDIALPQQKKFNGKTYGLKAIAHDKRASGEYIRDLKDQGFLVRTTEDLNQINIYVRKKR